VVRSRRGVAGRLRALPLDRQTWVGIALVCVADVLVGASFGAITVSGGMPAWVPVAMSVLVFAGGAQFAAVGAVLAGGSAASGVVAGLVLNARLLPFGIAVADVLGRGWPARLVGAHLVTDESVAFTLRQPDRARRRAAFWVCGLGLFVCWNLAVLGGTVLGSLLDDTDALGLDAAFPAVILALVVPVLDRRNLPAAAAGAVLAVVGSLFLTPGLPVLVALVGLVLLRRRAAGQADGAEPEGTR
jgi:4-azaleucine resistance transporter AzlC